MNQNRPGKASAGANRCESRSAEDWHDQGICLARQGRDGEATACFEKAVQIQPGNFQARNALVRTLAGLGNTRLTQGRVRQAAACFRRAAEIAPQVAGIWNNLGVILLAQGEANQATDMFRRAVDLDSAFAEAYTNLALALERQQEYDGAAEALEQLVTIRPDHGSGWRHLGLMRFNRGELAGASEALWKGLAIDPDFDDIDRILLILIQAGRYLGHCSKKAAGTWIAHLRDLDPQSPLPDLLDYGLCSLAPHTAKAVWQHTAFRVEQAQAPAGRCLGILGRKDSLNQAPADSAVLLNFGRSGTGFLHSLLDGHPQVTTMPGIYLKDFFFAGRLGSCGRSGPKCHGGKFLLPL